MEAIYKSEWCKIETVVYDREKDPDAHFAAKMMISRRNAKRIRRIYQKADEEVCKAEKVSLNL